ncbi:MAG TPA: DUF3562 domain-containing protein [Acidiferrobacterales bacterium]|nr:DUF3562 domain-containing protein [Acidiferrobacterales bacterium]
MDLTMYAEHSKPSHQEGAVEFLAHKSHVSIDDVARLYDTELAKLAVDARTTSYLPIFAIRNVREMLRQRSTGKLAPA